MRDEQTQIIKAAFELLKICNGILHEEEKSRLNPSQELSELARQYRRWLIEQAQQTAKFDIEKYVQ